MGNLFDELQVMRIALLEKGECSGLEMAALLGRWTWSCLVCRPALAVLGASYRFAQRLIVVSSPSGHPLCASWSFMTRSFLAGRTRSRVAPDIVRLTPLRLASVSSLRILIKPPLERLP